MTDQQIQEQWHLSKSVPVTIVGFLLLQTLGIVVWATRLDSRVGSLEISQHEQNVRIADLEKFGERIAVINERQQLVLKTLDSNARKIDVLVDALNKANH